MEKPETIRYRSPDLKSARCFSRWYVLLYELAAAGVTAVCAVSFAYLWAHGVSALKWLIPAFVLVNVCAPLLFLRVHEWRLRVSAHGIVMLWTFLLSSALSVLYHLIRLPMLWRGEWKVWLWSALTALLVESAVFWNGILSIYLTSEQLNVRWRVVGALCGLIPVLHLVILGKLISVVVSEVNEETARAERDRARRTLRVCETKYPILLVHGVFFRDYRFFNYWGRIPEALEANGATIYYGKQQSAASVYECGEELAARIRTICAETGCGKVNVIAHSKGGLDIRAAMAKYGAADYIASVTTVNTPHRGCGFADHLLSGVDAGIRDKVASAYNAALRLLGDRRPDFLSAVSDLTASRCAVLDGELLLPDGSDVFCQSVGSCLSRPTGGRFPLNFSWALVRFFDGPNDGLVSESSFPWGSRYICLPSPGRRGISHGDVIDLNRENLPAFDVREFYVWLVSDLKRRGY